MHMAREDFGAQGHRMAGPVTQVATELGAKSILDYGCGKATLAPAITGFTVLNYDPARPDFDAPPHPADLVACLDVLEHIEPEFLDNVLDDIKRLAIKGVFLTIATRPATKVLPDGRNAHLIQQPLQWWMPKIWDRWELNTFHANELGFSLFATVPVPRPQAS